MNVIHNSVVHDSATRHVSGSAVYIDDMKAPEGLLHAWVITSERAHAKITAIDLAQVAAAPGVIGVFTASDIPGQNDAGPILMGEPLLARDSVTYWGEAIAVIAATSLAAARAAAPLARITYEDLPSILTIDEARAAESYVISPL